MKGVFYMKKRFLFAALLLVVMLVASCAYALADADVPPPSQISDNPDFSICEWNRTIAPYTSDELKITRVVSSITKLSSSSIYIRGVTDANKLCDVVGVFMYVEQWKNSKWNTYTTVSYSEFDAYTAEGIKVVNVDSGYYYRVVVEHRAIKQLDKVYDLSNTQGILVN